MTSEKWKDVRKAMNTIKRYCKKHHTEENVRDCVFFDKDYIKEDNPLWYCEYCEIAGQVLEMDDVPNDRVFNCGTSFNDKRVMLAAKFLHEYCLSHCVTDENNSDACNCPFCVNRPTEYSDFFCAVDGGPGTLYLPCEWPIKYSYTE